MVSSRSAGLKFDQKDLVLNHDEEREEQKIAAAHFQASLQQFKRLQSMARGSRTISLVLYIAAFLALILGAYFSDPMGKVFQRSGSLLVAMTLPVIALSTWASAQLIDQSDSEFGIKGVGIRVSLLDTGIATGIIASFGTIVWGFGEFIYRFLANHMSKLENEMSWFWTLGSTGTPQ